MYRRTYHTCITGTVLDTSRVYYGNATRLVLYGPFGTGKTILLREKCREMAEKHSKQQFYFVIPVMEEIGSLVLFHDISNYFPDLSNVSVIKV